MIFAYTLDKVISGEKWQTRRLAKPDEYFDVSAKRVSKQGKRTIFEVGKTYAVQPNRGRKAIARIRLTGLRKESIMSISNIDARAEGFSSREDFILAWRNIHGQSADLTREVWVLEFELFAIVADEIKVLYESRVSKNRGAYNGYDLPAAVERVSGIGLYSGHYEVR